MLSTLRYALFWLLLLGQAGACLAQVDSLARYALEAEVRALQQSDLLRNGTLAVHVQLCKSGETILSHQAAQSVPAASTLKLITTATALNTLGAEHRFKTQLLYDGVIEADVLHGNLYIKGEGDPSLGAGRSEGYPTLEELLDRWSRLVQQLNIKTLHGSIVVDASHFDAFTLADSWVWGDLGNYYGAGVSGLNLNENMYRVWFRPGSQVGEAATLLGTEPSLDYLTFDNRVTTGPRGSGDKVYLYASPLSNQVVLTGTVPAGVKQFGVKGAIPNPAYAFAYLLQKRLATYSVRVTEGIQVLHHSSAKPQSSYYTLDEVLSPPLSELARQTNEHSLNLYADAFFKTSGLKLAESSTFDETVRAMRTYWEAQKLNMEGFYIKDGSGLSPSGSLTATNLTQVLTHMTTQPTFGTFYNGIAILGQTGTVRNLAKNTPAAGNIRAKSGSIEGTRAFSGYVTTRSGQLASFALIAHRYAPGRSAEVSKALVSLMVRLAEL